MTNAFIVDAVRSPIGKKNGTLSHARADEVGAQVLNALVERNSVDPAEVEDVQWGCVSQVDEQAWNIGRNTALTAGWPVSVAGTTVDRQCGSSMQTNFNAAAAIMAGRLDLVVSGGVEMMSRVLVVGASAFRTLMRDVPSIKDKVLAAVTARIPDEYE